MPLRNRPQVGVVDTHSRTDRADERGAELGIEAVAHEHLDAGLAHGDDSTFELRSQGIDIGLRAQAVIAPGAQAHQVRLHLEHLRHLVIDDAVEQTASDGQIGVGQVGAAHRRLGEHEREPVGPAAVPVLGARIGIHQPLTERVSDGDVGGDRLKHQGSFSLRTTHSVLFGRLTQTIRRA